MASSRIVNYDKDKRMIHYYYEHHKTKERVDVEEDIFEFMKKLIVHIPEAQFKMISTMASTLLVTTITKMKQIGN